MTKTILCFILLMTLLVGCEVLEPTQPEVKITVTYFEQPYYEYLGGWSNLIEVSYSIRNTGDKDIDYYKIWFKATCIDGKEYSDWTNGTGLDAGHSIDDNLFINVSHKIVTSVRVTDYELTTY